MVYNIEKGGAMTIKEISDGFKDLFNKTGKIYYFMMSRNIEKLSDDVEKLAELEKELEEESSEISSI